MNKLYIALVAVLFASFAFEAEARRYRNCGTRCETSCNPCPKQECCDVQTHVVCEKPICEKVITQKVCAEPVCKIQKIKTYECPPGYTQVGSESVTEQLTAN